MTLKPLAGLCQKDFTEDGYFYQMGSPPVRVDILMGISGISFEDAWINRITEDFGGLTVNFISREDLIIAKRASGRPQDLIDADLLRKRAIVIIFFCLSSERLPMRQIRLGECGSKPNVINNIESS